MPNPATPNMGLIMPTEGSDDGDWDRLINDAADVLDGHGHTAGQGVRITTAALDIDADLTFASGGSYSAITNVKAVDFQPQAASAMTAYAGAFFVNSSDSNNLYFRSQAGTNVRITNGATLDTTTVGGIGGDYSSIPAELNFVDANKEYTFKSTAAGNWSRIHGSSVRIAEHATTDATYIEISAPSTLASSYTITPASALPTTNTAPVHITTGGALIYGPDESVNIPAIGVALSDAMMANVSITSGYVTLVASSLTDWRVPLPLKQGDRLKSVTLRLNRGGAGEIGAVLRRWDGSGTETALATAVTNSGTGWTTVTVATGLTDTVTALESFTLGIDLNNTANQVSHVTYTFDHP